VLDKRYEGQLQARIESRKEIEKHRNTIRTADNTRSVQMYKRRRKESEQT
jgi:hypothetical protein